MRKFPRIVRSSCSAFRRAIRDVDSVLVQQIVERGSRDTEQLCRLRKVAARDSQRLADCVALGTLPGAAEVEPFKLGRIGGQSQVVCSYVLALGHDHGAIYAVLE